MGDIGIIIWHACANSHRQSCRDGSHGPQCISIPLHMSPDWQNLPSMRCTVTCALPMASGTCQLPSAPMGGGARRSPASCRTVLQPLRAEEREATDGTEWSTLAKQEFLFQCTSVAIARGSTVILCTLRQGWQQQPSANTNHSKAHHWQATPKAREASRPKRGPCCGGKPHLVGNTVKLLTHQIWAPARQRYLVRPASLTTRRPEHITTTGPWPSWQATSAGKLSAINSASRGKTTTERSDLRAVLGHAVLMCVGFRCRLSRLLPLDKSCVFARPKAMA